MAEALQTVLVALVIIRLLLLLKVVTAADLVIAILLGVQGAVAVHRQLVVQEHRLLAVMEVTVPHLLFLALL